MMFVLGFCYNRNDLTSQMLLLYLFEDMFDSVCCIYIPITVVYHINNHVVE